MTQFLVLRNNERAPGGKEIVGIAAGAESAEEAVEHMGLTAPGSVTVTEYVPQEFTIGVQTTVSAVTPPEAPEPGPPEEPEEEPVEEEPVPEGEE